MIFHLFFILLFSTSAFAAPNIVVSIPPIHTLVSHLTQGVTSPKLLLEHNQSAHHFHLKPSQLSLLNAADLVVLIHPNFETGLKKSFQRINADRKMKLSEANANYHVWLDIDRMIDFSHKLTTRLKKIDAKNQWIYTRNLQRLLNKLQALKTNISQQLAAYQGEKIASFSNAFSYFFNAYQLRNSTTVSRYHGERLSISKILTAKRMIKKTQTKCLITTTETPKKRLNIFTEDSIINTARINIIGHDYFKLMQTITDKIDRCLK